MCLPTDLSSHSPDDNVQCPEPECKGAGRWETSDRCAKCQGSGGPRVPTGVKCWSCNGTRSKRYRFSWIVCPSCDGTGEYHKYYRCSDCHGLGKLNVRQHACGFCDASGSIGVVKLIVRKAIAKYITERVSDFEDCATKMDLVTLERAKKMSLMMMELIQESKSQSRQSELFPIEIRERIERAERQLADSATRLDTARAQLLMNEEEKKRHTKECRKNIQNLGIQEFDFD
jgi:hypothetical protein